MSRHAPRRDVGLELLDVGQSEPSDWLSTDQRLDVDFDPSFNVECRCGRVVQLAPYQLIGRNGITAATRAWSLRERFRCLKCKRRPPKRMWIERWRD
jgi:hypothetical protein